MRNGEINKVIRTIFSTEQPSPNWDFTKRGHYLWKGTGYIMWTEDQCKESQEKVLTGACTSGIWHFRTDVWLFFFLLGSRTHWKTFLKRKHSLILALGRSLLWGCKCALVALFQCQMHIREAHSLGSDKDSPYMIVLKWTDVLTEASWVEKGEIKSDG